MKELDFHLIIFKINRFSILAQSRLLAFRQW